ncbi:MAG: Uma2 family endonuclease [Spirosomataceae bacterium]
MAIAVSTERWTYERMTAELPAESRYELRDFHLLEMPSPKPKHQRVLLNLYDSVKPFIKSQKLGEIFIAPLDVIFDEGNVAQPDLIFIANENKQIIKESSIMGVPDVLVEVVSKGSVARDYIEKKNDFERFSVKEYWIIDSLNESIWVYSQNTDNKFELYSYAEADETAKSKYFTDFSIAHDSIFDE